MHMPYMPWRRKSRTSNNPNHSTLSLGMSLLYSLALSSLWDNTMSLIANTISTLEHSKLDNLERLYQRLDGNKSIAFSRLVLSLRGLLDSSSGTRSTLY